MSLKRILLVDASPRDVEMTREALKESHFANEVIALRDGAEALDYLFRRAGFAGRSDSDPATLRLDLKMPRVDGLEALPAVKSGPALETIPVVLIPSPSSPPAP